MNPKDFSKLVEMGEPSPQEKPDVLVMACNPDDRSYDLSVDVRGRLDGSTVTSLADVELEFRGDSYWAFKTKAFQETGRVIVRQDDDDGEEDITDALLATIQAARGKFRARVPTKWRP
jgi:hypothetical protein